MQAHLGRIIIYTKKVDEMIAFYRDHFGFDVVQHANDRIVELVAPGRGANIMLHALAKGRKEGQTLVKLVFDVTDVAGFKAKAAQRGLAFGPIHDADSYSFANAKDPAQNTIQISSRAFKPQ